MNAEAATRRLQLEQHSADWLGCTKCALAQGRTQVVVGAGDPDADLMFVGEAPGFHEDKQGIPFVGQAGKLLDSLLAEIGLDRSQVYIANVLKCRPPGNRDPLPDEIAACETHLFKQVELIRPRVICTLGNFATKLLTGQPYGHHPRARTGPAAPDRRGRAFDLPDLSPGGRAVHAVHAGHVARGHRTFARAPDRAAGRAGSCHRTVPA